VNECQESKDGADRTDRELNARNTTRDKDNNSDKKKATIGEVTAERTTGQHVYYGRKDL
jgi:hypothetical protein